MKKLLILGALALTVTQANDIHKNSFSTTFQHVILPDIIQNYKNLTHTLKSALKDMIYGKLDVKDIGFAETIGLRPTMEDAHHIEIKKDFAFFGLYDGHGGRQVADFAAQRLHKNMAIVDCSNHVNIPLALTEAFIKTHKDLDHTGFNVRTQGCTAIVVCIVNKHLTVANAGDSRAVLCCSGMAIPLSIDHKPDRLSEKERIESLGGKIIHWGVPRVNGQLAISRALGDKGLNPFVIPEPEISQRKLIADDEFLILGCDGIWDVIDNQLAVDTIKTSLKNNAGDCNKAAAALKDIALESGSTDNISVIVISLKKFK